MDKTAKLFGATYDSDRVSNAAIPYSGRKKEYVRYLNTKAKESPTKLVNALLGGAAAGGVVGGIAGSVEAVLEW